MKLLTVLYDDAGYHQQPVDGFRFSSSNGSTVIFDGWVGDESGQTAKNL